MVHVCFAVHDSSGTYSQYAGVTLSSMLDHIDAEVLIHFLHDDTLREADKAKFQHIAERYKQNIHFYELQRKAFSSCNAVCLNAGIGTLFRLKLTEILPENIQRIIYLDSDLVFNLDIAGLWNFQLRDKLIAARVDVGTSRWLCKAENLPREAYFNAGVLLLDLEGIRKRHELFQECMDFFMKYPEAEHADQDALNYVFRGEGAYLPPQYNMFTRSIRLDKNEEMKEGIFHFAGDSLCLDEPMGFDKLFLRYWLESPWSDVDKVLRLFDSVAEVNCKRRTGLLSIINRVTCEDCKKIVFGATSVMNSSIESFLHLIPGHDYFVDNNQAIQRTQIKGITVYNPRRLLLEDQGKFIVIVLSRNHYQEIKGQLVGYGLKENEDFVDGRYLLPQAEGEWQGAFSNVHNYSS